jgi:endo-1,3-1,4-beta-glycanase ExoK
MRAHRSTHTIMRRLPLALLLTLLALPASASAAVQPVAWTPTEHQLGRSALSSANVLPGPALRLPAGTTDGAEIRSTSTFASGTVHARLKVADAPSSITGFFLYAPPDLASEIDIEVYDDPSGRVMLTTYAGGRQTHTETRELGFDPTAGYHDYAIAWGANRVAFSVDGATLRTWTTGVPKAPMNLYVNAWFPTWLAGLAPATDALTSVAALDYRPH